MGSGDNKIAAFKSGKSSSSSGPSSSGSGDAKIAAIKAAQTGRSKAETPAEYAIKAGISSTDLMRAGMPASVVREVAAAEPVKQSGQVVQQTSTGGFTLSALDIVTDKEAVVQRVEQAKKQQELTAAANAVNRSDNLQQMRRELITGQQTIGYIPGQKPLTERIREAEKQEAAESMDLGVLEKYAADYESYVSGKLEKLTLAEAGTKRFAGGVLEGVAYTPVAVPRLAVGLVSNPATTARELVISIPEAIIADPARGTGQLIGTLAAGKAIGKGVTRAGAVVKDVKLPKVNPNASRYNPGVVEDYVQLVTGKSNTPVPTGPRNVLPTSRAMNIDGVTAQIAPRLDMRLPKAYQEVTAPAKSTGATLPKDIRINAEGIRASATPGKVPASLLKLITDERGTAQLIPGSTGQALKPITRQVKTQRAITNRDIVPSLESQIRQRSLLKVPASAKAKPAQINIPQVAAIAGLSPSIAQRYTTKQLQGLTPSQLFAQAQAQIPAQAQAQTQAQIQTPALMQVQVPKLLQATGTAQKTQPAIRDILPKTPVPKIPNIPIPMITPDIKSSGRKGRRSGSNKPEYERLLNDWKDPTKIKWRL